MNTIEYIISVIDQSLASHYFKGIKFWGIVEQIEKDGQVIPAKYKGDGDYDFVGFDDTHGLNIYHRILNETSVDDYELGIGNKPLTTDTYNIILVAYGSQSQVLSSNNNINNKISKEIKQLIPKALTKVQLVNLKANTGVINIEETNFDKNEILANEAGVDNHALPDSLIFTITYAITITSFGGCDTIECGVTEPLINLKSICCENINHSTFGLSGEDLEQCGRVVTVYDENNPEDTGYGISLNLDDEYTCSSGAIRITNEDQTFDETVSEDIELPNININDSNGDLIENIPSVKDYNVGDSPVSNSDDSYLVSLKATQPLEIPDTPVSNSNDSYVVSQPSTKPLEIPDTRIHNSDSSYDVNQPSTITKSLPDITVTKYDGTTFTYPAAKNLVTTQIPTLSPNFSANNLTPTTAQTVTFTDSSADSPTLWAWNFGDGYTSNLQNPTHQYLSPGTYTVRLVTEKALSIGGSITKTGYITVSGTDLRLVTEINNVNGAAFSTAILSATFDASKIAYNRVQLPNQSTSYATYDLGYQINNSVHYYTKQGRRAVLQGSDSAYRDSTINDFIKLSPGTPNDFGNLDRFTDNLGGQTYAGNYLIDHYTGYGIYLTLLSSLNWANSLAAANALSVTSNSITYGNFYVGSTWHISTIINNNVNFVGINYEPFKTKLLPFWGVDVRIWTSQIAPDLTSAKVIIHNLSTFGFNVNKSGITGGLTTLAFRNHY